MICLSLSLLFVACGGGPQADDVIRSQKEYELAVGLWQENNLPGAFHHLFRATELDNDNADAHLLLGNLFMMRGNNEKAEKHLREVLRIRTRSPEARNSLGVLFINQRRYEQAVRELREATSDILNREPHLAWGNLGWAYLEMRNYPDAIDALLRAVRHEPRFCVGYYRLGQAYMKLGKAKEADRALTAGLESTDKRCGRLQETWLMRGKVRLEQGEHDRARDDFEKCVEVDADSPVGSECKEALDATPAHPPEPNAPSES